MDGHEGADAIERAWQDGLRPDPLLTVSEWADRYRVLSQRASSEPGRWRTERTPYLREIMDCLSPASPVQRVALMKGAQIGGTECGTFCDLEVWRPACPNGVTPRNVTL
jgi:phage terminase large subunit GpA-like protein